MAKPSREPVARTDEPPPLALAVRFAPSGALHLERHADGPVVLAPALARRVADALEHGAAAFVLHLGASEPTAALPAPLGWLRDLARAFVTALCALPEAERDALAVPFAPSELDRFALSVPPMPGAEYATRDALSRLWSSLADALRETTRGSSVAAWLRAQSPLWHLVGRVCFHLAENKRGAPDTPFAFLATYAARLSADGRVQHRPLADALREHAGARDRAALLALLEPVQAAANASDVVRALVDTDAIYQPLAWTAAEAYAFLRELPAIEACGVRVRVPDFWNARRPPRPRVAVKLGSNAPATLGADALLDFAVELTLEGESLDDQERERILSSTDGLVLVKGRWIEVDRERLARVLAEWKRLESAASREGVSFAEGMRLLAGASIAQDAPDEADEAGDTRAAWSDVNAGPWLANALAELRADDVAADATAGLRAELRPYQSVGARWLWTLHRLALGGCLADDMGLGKTVQVLALLVRIKRANEKGPSLLVLPASLIANWRAEIARFAPGLRAFVAHASVTPAATLAATNATTLEAYDVVLTSYGSLLRLAWLGEVAWNLVVFDEAQALKNPGAKQTRAARSLRARHRIALTGTPVENRLGDLWSLFDVTSPGLLGTAKQFQRYVRALEKDATNGYAPLRRLVRPWILRRLKSDPRVIADLPDKTELRAFCGLTKTQAVLYEEAVEQLALRLRGGLEGIERRGAILASLMRLKQICNHPAQWLGTGAYAPDESGKFARLAELCEPIAARQDKVLVFTQFREMAAPIERFLAGIFGRDGLVLHGQTPVAKRRELVDAFQREDGPPFFVLSLKAGGTGLNLTAASHVIHFDRWWNPAVENQATDRAYRIGQKKNVLVHKFVCRGTVEEKIDALIESKRALSRELLEDGDEGGAVLVTEMSNDALLALVKLDLRGALDAG